MAERLAEPRLFDEIVEVARNACAGGASVVAAAIGCAAYLDNPLTGLPALRACMQRARALAPEDGDWLTRLAQPLRLPEEEARYLPGFGFVERRQADRIRRCAWSLVEACPERSWLLRRVLGSESAREALGPLNLTGLSALVLAAHGVQTRSAERLFLWWRMEPALAAAQEAREVGLSSVPFLADQMQYVGPRPALEPLSFDDLARKVGLV